MIRSWHHSSLAVRDLGAAMDFYRRAFGFEPAFEERGMSGQIESMTGLAGLTCDIAQLRAPGSSHVLELIAFKPPGAASGSEFPGIGDRPLGPGAAHIAFTVDDLEATMRRIEALGAVRLGEVTRFEDGRCAYYREPSGSFIEIEQPHEAPA